MANAILRASGIYAIRNIINGKVYIGRAVNMQKRVRRHFVMLSRGEHHSKKFQCAFIKYGEGSFIGETLLLCAPDHLQLFEQLLIDGFDVYRTGYNSCPISGAPMAGRTTSEETRAKQSKAMLGRKKSQIAKQRSADARRGKKVSPQRAESIRIAARTPEARAAISLRMIGNKNSAGTVPSAETKAKLSASWTPERKAALIALIRSPERRAAASMRMMGNKYASGKKDHGRPKENTDTTTQ